MDAHPHDVESVAGLGDLILTIFLVTTGPILHGKNSLTKSGSHFATSSVTIVENNVGLHFMKTSMLGVNIGEKR